MTSLQQLKCISKIMNNLLIENYHTSIGTFMLQYYENVLL